MLRNGLEPWHLLVVAIIIILLFGSKKLPEAARGLGRSMRILKSEAKAMKDDDGPQATASTASAGETAEPSAVKLVQAAPGDTTSARTVSEDSVAR
ncbi:Sec-independent protein translocase subunit TatA [Streptomyces sp. NPDC008092]|uniref:Sec-independent protein translocase subunit TatA n=1 Tax=Streptomyces sp. NPDC008092 TaxID=3364808 RepID=UPI0036E22BA3